VTAFVSLAYGLIRLRIPWDIADVVLAGDAFTDLMRSRAPYNVSWRSFNPPRDRSAASRLQRRRRGVDGLESGSWVLKVLVGPTFYAPVAQLDRAAAF
jgi:hypothetical protein